MGVVIHPHTQLPIEQCTAEFSWHFLVMRESLNLNYTYLTNKCFIIEKVTSPPNYRL